MSNAVEKCCLDFEERSQSIRLGIPSVTKQKFITTWSWYPGISPKQEFIVNLNQKDWQKFSIKKSFTKIKKNELNISHQIQGIS